MNFDEASARKMTTLFSSLEIIATAKIRLNSVEVCQLYPFVCVVTVNFTKSRFVQARLSENFL